MLSFKLNVVVVYITIQIWSSKLDPIEGKSASFQNSKLKLISYTPMTNIPDGR